MKTSLSLALALLAVLVCLGPAHDRTARPAPPRAAGPSDTPAVVDHIGGAVHAVALREVGGCALAFAGGGPRLVVWDVCDAGRPREVGRSAPLPDVVLGVALSGPHALVAAGRAGLRVFDIADPVRPTEVGAVDAPPDADGEDEAIGLAVDGHHVFVALGARGVAVVDVSDPARPRETGRWHVPFRGTAFAVAAGAGRAFVADGDAGLVVLDVSDPAHPREVGALGAAGGQHLFATAVAAAGTTVYVAGGPHLWAVDVADPASPRPAGPPLTDALTDGKALALAGDDLFVVRVASLRSAAYALRLARVDARAPGDLRQTGATELAMPLDDVFALNAPRIGLAAGGGFVWLAAASLGLEAITVDAAGAPPNPLGALRLHAAFGPATHAAAVTRHGDAFLVPNGARDVQRFAAGPDDRLRYDARVLIAGFAVDAAVDGELAYIADGGLSIARVGSFDASRANMPLAHVAFDGGAVDVAVRGHRAYVADIGAGVHVVDVAASQHPAVMGRLPGIDRAAAVAVDGDRLAVASGAAVAVYDLAGTGGPALVSTAATAGLVEDVAIAGADVLAVGDGAGLTLLRLAGDRLDVLGTLDTGPGARRVAVAGDRAYVASTVGVVVVADIADRSAPRLVATLPLPGEASGVAVAGDRLVVAARGGGLFVLGDPGAAPTPAPTDTPRPVRTPPPGMAPRAWLPLACVWGGCAQASGR